ncbi:MAG: MFS transporter [Marinomonas sp.]
MRAFLSGRSARGTCPRGNRYGTQSGLPKLSQTSASKASPSASSSGAPLSRFEEYTLCIVIALSVANAYYIHPIISEVAEHFSVSKAAIGIVPTLNQLALAAGILFLLPLGDRVGNRTLVFIFSALQAVCLAVMAFAPSFVIFTAASTLLGTVTIAPYLLPAYASKRTAPAELGRVTALLTAGILFGILYARVGAGVMAEYFGWQTVYYLASGLMLVLVVTLRFLMRAKAKPAPDAPAPEPYTKLLASLLPLVKKHPEAALSGCIQSLNFGMFIAIWLGLALHLTSPEMGYSVDLVGYLAFTAGLSMVTTPRMGVWADRMGPERARKILACTQIVAAVLLYLFGWNLALLMIPILMNTVVGPVIDVTGRMTILQQGPAIRNRLITVYVVIMFTGGAVASTLATAAYDAAGWAGNCAIAFGFALCVASLSWFAERRQNAKKALQNGI